jgi:CheY-like chemotaxis protein/nitrogen-specific signal transduction histidine kinase
LSIITDVTERTRAQGERDQLLERELAARRRAEDAARARDQFLAIVSHELRSPLNGIQNWSYVLENHLDKQPPAVLRAIAGIRSGIEQQVRLIDDLLDATRIMSGKLSLVMQPTALLSIVNAAIGSVRAAAAAKQITIESAWGPGSDVITGDADRLQQIFWNLLSNAVKFTPAGGRIWLNATMASDEIVVLVHDSGMGIAPEFLPHMFEWFRRDQTDRSRAHDGLGLGLALVRHLCELHGGKATAQSAGIGQGATFGVQLPLRVSSAAIAAAPILALPTPPMMLVGLRVLLVDDQPESLESLASLLQHAGAKTTTMSSGERARKWMEHCDEGEIPHVLLCDIAMPGEDGYTTLRKIRNGDVIAGGRSMSRVPAIAISAFAQREDRIRALAAGFQMYMTKPISTEELIVALAAIAGRQLPEAESGSAV